MRMRRRASLLWLFICCLLCALSVFASRAVFLRMTAFPSEYVNDMDGSKLVLVTADARQDGRFCGLRSFYYSLQSVRIWQLRRFIGATKYVPEAPSWEWAAGAAPDGDAVVTYRDASAFAKWAGLRLPTCEEVLFLKSASQTEWYYMEGFILEGPSQPGLHAFHVAASPEKLRFAEL